MKEITPRPIQPDELAVLKAALERAPIESISESVISSINSLNVIGLCECGCKSIYFLPINRKDRRIADGVGRTLTGKFVEIMVWASENNLHSLDIVDYESSGKLPLVESITTYERINA